MAIKKNEIFETTWMELEGIILSEISQSEKDKYHVTSHICEFKIQTDEHKGREVKII